jgi:Protein of unknown function (DUF3137)
MITVPNVKDLMNGGLADWLNGQAIARAEAKEKFYWTGGGGIVVAILIGIILSLFDYGSLAYFAAIMIGAGAIAWASHIRQTMINNLKEGMNGAIATALKIDYSVSAFTGQEFELAKRFRLIPSFDDSAFEDQWHGNIGGADFIMYEAKLTQQQSKAKTRHSVTVFQGVILRFQFARPFLSTTLIRRERLKFTLFGVDKSFGGMRLDRLNMVDPKFESSFDVYSSDPVEGRYLVHPVYCERLLAIENEMRGSKLSALFHQGDMIISIHTGEMFESASLDAEMDHQGIERTIMQFQSIAGLITLLNERPRN